MSTTTKPSDNTTIPFDQLGTSREKQANAISKLLKTDFDIIVNPRIKFPFTGDVTISVKGKNAIVKGPNSNGGQNNLPMRCMHHIHPTDGLAIGVLSSKKN